MIISVTGTKGGVGKTTFAINFAFYAQHVKGKKVCIVDADIQGSSRRLVREKRDGMIPLICFAVSGNCRDDIKRLDEDHDIVIVDTGGHSSDTLNFVLSVANICVLPFNTGTLDTAEAKTIKDIIDFVSEFNNNLKALAYINRVPTLASMICYADNAQKEVEKYFEVLPIRIANRDKPYSKLANGITIFEQYDESAIKAQREFSILADYILEHSL